MTDFAGIVTRLEAALTGPLPGSTAQLLMSPRPPRGWRPGFDQARARNAAGLLLLFPRGPEAHLVLTVRAGTLERHGGQVSLPGGVIDPGETVERAALREAHEEIGLRPEEVRTIGALSSLDIHVSGFRLHPIVGTVSGPPALRPSDAEVARVLEIPVARLMDPRCISWKSLDRDGLPVTAPAFLVDDAEIWGATAMVLAEFLALLGWTGPSIG